MIDWWKSFLKTNSLTLGEMFSNQPSLKCSQFTFKILFRFILPLTTSWLKELETSTRSHISLSYMDFNSSSTSTSQLYHFLMWYRVIEWGRTIDFDQCWLDNASYTLEISSMKFQQLNEWFNEDQEFLIYACLRFMNILISKHISIQLE